jgi:hypothetical protein
MAIIPLGQNARLKPKSVIEQNPTEVNPDSVKEQANRMAELIVVMACRLVGLWAAHGSVCGNVRGQRRSGPDRRCVTPALHGDGQRPQAPQGEWRIRHDSTGAPE